jgi:REP element-mobilizing transposase RayT
MSQSLANNLVHLVYSTKHRMNWIPEFSQESLWAYQAGIFREWDSPAIVIGGVEDHVHALFSLSKNHALKKIVEEVKKGSSKWMKTAEGTSNRDFAWQGGYGAFSVSKSNEPDVKNYIQNQAEHHRNGPRAVPWAAMLCPCRGEPIIPVGITFGRESSEVVGFSLCQEDAPPGFRSLSSYAARNNMWLRGSRLSVALQ